MKTTIVCGVLGAGKTTFIKNILKRRGGKTVVLVNDFGAAGIDGEIISAGGIETIELQSGCVCCTLRFDLIQTVQKIIDRFDPDDLFIEPSGVASPSGVLDVLDTLRMKRAAVVGVVDATDFTEAYEAAMYGWFFKSQVVLSDVVLVNKTDLVDEEKVRKTICLIEELNQNAVIVPTVNAMLDKDLLQYKTKLRPENDKEGHQLRIDSITIKFDRQIPMESLRDVFGKLSGISYGNVIRAKALVRTDQGPYRFDLASKQVTAEQFDREVRDSRLVIIGTDLKEDMIRKLTGSV